MQQIATLSVDWISDAELIIVNRWYIEWRHIEKKSFFFNFLETDCEFGLGVCCNHIFVTFIALPHVRFTNYHFKFELIDELNGNFNNLWLFMKYLPMPTHLDSVEFIFFDRDNLCKPIRMNGKFYWMAVSACCTTVTSGDHCGTIFYIKI